MERAKGKEGRNETKQYETEKARDKTRDKQAGGRSALSLWGEIAQARATAGRSDTEIISQYYSAYNTE